MTVRLLVPYGKYPKNTNLTTGADTEAMLLRTGQADTQTSIGTAYIDPVPIDRSGPVTVETVGDGDKLIADNRTIFDVSLFGGLNSLVGDEVAAPSGAITIASVSASGNLTGTYYYNVTYVTDAGETAPWPGTPNTTGAIVSKQVSLSNIPVSSDSRVIARKLWRNIGTGAIGTNPDQKDYQYLATIPDNTTTTYVDNGCGGR